jgi:hypothetical protein
MNDRRIEPRIDLKAVEEICAVGKLAQEFIERPRTQSVEPAT